MQLVRRLSSLKNTIECEVLKSQNKPMNCSVFNFEVSDLRVCADGSVVPHSCGSLAGHV